MTKPVSLLSAGYAYLCFDSSKLMKQCLKSHETIPINFKGETFNLKLKEAEKVASKVSEINEFNTQISVFNSKKLPNSCKPP